MVRLPPTSAATGPPTVLARLLTILEAVKTSPEPPTVGDIAATTGIPKSTAARLVSDLVDRGYLERGDAGIHLGLRLFELGARATIPRALTAAAAPVIDSLARQTGERVVLWVQQGTEMVSLTAVPGRLPMLPTNAGMRSPAVTTASGKAYLAFCQDKLTVARVSATLFEDQVTRFRDELDQVRSTGFANDPGAAYRGVQAMASPIIAAKHDVIGAISVAGPVGSMHTGAIAPLVRAAGTAVSRRLAEV